MELFPLVPLLCPPRDRKKVWSVPLFSTTDETFINVIFSLLVYIFQAAETVYNKSAPLLPFADSNVFHANIVHWRILTGPIDPDDNCKVVYEVTFDVKVSFNY